MVLMSLPIGQMIEALLQASPETRAALHKAKARACSALESLSPATMTMTKAGVLTAYGPNSDPQMALLVVATPQRAISVNFRGWPEFIDEEVEKLSNNVKWAACALLVEQHRDEEAVAVALSRIGRDTFMEFEEQRVQSHALWGQR